MNRNRNDRNEPKAVVEIIRARKLIEMLGIGRSTLYDWQNKRSPRFDPTFPKRIRLGKASVGWLLEEVIAWIAARANERLTS